MMLQDKKIAIVGGGPGGLTLARLLEMNGAQVHVYERDAHPHVRVQGATLDLHADSGLLALEKANLMDAFKRHYRPGADKMCIADADGKLHFDQHVQAKEEQFGDEYFRPEIDRGPLRKLLLDSLRPETVIWDRRFVTMKPHGDGWNLHFENGAEAYADLVIGADGTHSKIRPFLTPIQPQYLGITAIEGTVENGETSCPQVNALLRGGKIFAMGHSQLLIVSSKGHGAISFYPSLHVDENWVRDCGIDFGNAEQVSAWFKATFKDWNPLWQELFVAEQVSFVPRPILAMPVDQNWETRPNLTLLGDAAHVMPPYAGEGVNMAMRDAMELSERLLSDAFPNLQAAIAHYEAEMRARAAAASIMSTESMEMLHSPQALSSMLSMFTPLEA